MLPKSEWVTLYRPAVARLLDRNLGEEDGRGRLTQIAAVLRQAPLDPPNVTGRKVCFQIQKGADVLLTERWKERGRGRVTNILDEEINAFISQNKS